MFFIFSFCSKSDVCYWNFLFWMQLQNSKVLILISWSEEVKLHYGMQKLTDLAPFLSLECRCQNAAWRPLVPWSLYHILLVVIYFLWVCNVSFLNIFICEIIFSYFCSSWNAIKFHYLWNWLSSVMNFCWVAYRKRKTSSIRLTELSQDVPFPKSTCCFNCTAFLPLGSTFHARNALNYFSWERCLKSCKNVLCF
jgi:hypothetical protein